MEKALQDEVQAMIDGAIKPVTDQVGSLAEAVKPVAGLVTQMGEVSKNVGVIADTIKNAPPAAVAEKTGGAKDKPLTAEDVLKLLNERDAKLTGSAKRDAFIAEKLKDVPAVYRGQLGNDESKWAAEEQSIRQQFQADLKSAGVKTPNVGGAPGGATTVETVDASKLTGVAAMEHGLAKSNPVGPGAVAQAATAAAK